MKQFIRALATAAVLLVLATGPGNAQDGPGSGAQAGNHFLRLEGGAIGFLHSVEGGAVSADVIDIRSGGNQDYWVKKQVGVPKYAAFDVQVGFAVKTPLYDWISNTWKRNYARKDGSIQTLNDSMDAVSERKFYHALITETGIPACDGSVHDPAYLNLRIAPELTEDAPAGGNVAKDYTQAYVQRTWLPSNFRLTIDGLDCSKVSRIEPFKVKTIPATENLGDPRELPRTPKINFPDLKITLHQSGEQTWNSWFKSFVIQGNNGEGREKGGVLEFLSPDLQTVLAKIKFFHLGIFKIAPTVTSPKNCDCDLCQTVVNGANSVDSPRKITAELYCERMEFEFVSPAANN